MKDEDLYDEEGRDLSIAASAHWRMLQDRIARHNHRLDPTTERLARKHGLNCHDPLRKLLHKLCSLSTDHPPILSVKPGHVVVQRDLTPWKKAKEQLEALGKALANADERLDAAVEDPVQREALMNADTPEEIVGWIAGVRDLRELVEIAAGIDGKGGNRPNPDWHARAAEMCREFWRDHMGENPSRCFNKTSRPKKGEPAGVGITGPGNEFSSWFCDVMYEVARMTPTQCETALKKKRPQMTAYY